MAIHPEVGFVNDPKALRHVVRDDEDVIGSYGNPESGRMVLDGDDAIQPAIDRARGMYGWFAMLTRSRQIVDKYRELVFRREFVRRIFPGSKFLIAARAPGPALASVAKWSQTHGDGQADWWGLRNQKWRIRWEHVVERLPGNADLKALELADCDDHLVRAGVEWTVTIRTAIAAADDDRSLVVSYADWLTRRHPGSLASSASADWIGHQGPRLMPSGPFRARPGRRPCPRRICQTS